MAILLGSKYTVDLKENDRIAIGITLPIQKGDTGYFQQSFQTSDQIKSNIRNLLLTIPGERIMQPSLGANLYNVLFNQNTQILETDVENAIISSLKFWLPFVTVEEIEIMRDAKQIDINTFEVTVKYSVPPQNRFETVTFNITQ